MSDRVVLRVKPEHRLGRGAYWRPSGLGYTDDLDKAGTWNVNRVPRSDRAEAIPVEQARADEGRS